MSVDWLSANHFEEFGAWRGPKQKLQRILQIERQRLANAKSGGLKKSTLIGTVPIGVNQKGPAANSKGTSNHGKGPVPNRFLVPLSNLGAQFPHIC
jgi:hypothetical protein